jgi:outer membrane protein assembly factor BamA
MARYPLPLFVLAAQVVSPGLAAAEAAPVLQFLDLKGGSEDDAAFAQVASNLVVGAPLADSAFETSLAAIRLTDRFRRVDGRLMARADGVVAEVRLDPWPAIHRLAWEGDARRPIVRKLIRGLRKGMRPGDLRLGVWTRDLQAKLVEAGYPSAKVSWTRGEGDRQLAIIVTLGQGSLLQRVEVAGDPAPYTRDELIHATGLVPGRSLWNSAAQLETSRNLRRMFQKHQRYEARADLAWDGAGTLRLTVAPGPRVLLDSEGDGLGWSTSLKDLVPLARAQSYSPDLLDEGDRRIVRFFRNQGYLDAQVGHRREVTRTEPPGYQEVTVTYSIHRGERSRLDGLGFEGNQAVSSAELTRAADLPGRILFIGAPNVTPDLLDALEARVQAYYLNLGYPEAGLRRQLERKDGSTRLVFRVREGQRRLLQRIRLELPPGGFGDPWSLADCLPLIFSDKTNQIGTGEGVRTYLSDRPALAGLRGDVTLTGDPGGPMVLTLVLAKPIPLLKADLGRVFTAIKQQRLPALGVVRPLMRLTLEPVADGTGVRIEVPAQPTEQVQRLVVTGSDKTHAKAVLRETKLQPGAPLDTDQLSRAQARLSYLGAFQRVDLQSLAVQGAPGDNPPVKDGPPVPWKEGDLQLNLEERPPYVITNSFSYDNTQGYAFGVGLNQLNVGGMGRTIDYGIRAGNGTIHNPTLAKTFPTGPYNRSVDSFTVGYTDPWFEPGILASWLPDRTQYRAEAAYIQEQQSLYLLHRRRVLNSLQWSLTPQVSFQLGHRWERVDTMAAPGIPGLTSQILSLVARYPDHVVISAPFAQVARDTRDNAFDPTRGMYSVARLDFANQLFLTSANSSFVKLDLRNQWTWPMGAKARAGVVALGLRVGMAKPTAASAQNLPLSERFFAGGPFTFRGVEPDALGIQAQVPQYDPTTNQPVLNNGQPVTYATPVGGQGLALINLEYRFPMIRPTVWGEVFVDSGQVYQSLSHQPAKPGVNGLPDTPATGFPPFRTALGLGLIFKIGIPLKIEYAADIKRILGQPRSQDDVDTQLKSLLVSAGFQF